METPYLGVHQTGSRPVNDFGNKFRRRLSAGKTCEPYMRHDLTLNTEHMKSEANARNRRSFPFADPQSLALDRVILSAVDFINFGAKGDGLLPTRACAVAIGLNSGCTGRGRRWLATGCWLHV